MRRSIKTHVPAIAPAARARSLTTQTAQKAKQAKLELLVIVPLMAVTVAAYLKREELFGADTPVRVAATVAMVALGWLLAGDARARRRAPRRRRRRRDRLNPELFSLRLNNPGLGAAPRAPAPRRGPRRRPRVPQGRLGALVLLAARHRVGHLRAAEAALHPR